MRIDLAERTNVLPSLSGQVRIEQVDPDDDEVMSAALSVRNEAFRGHHGHVDLEFDEYAEVWRGANKYDRKGWWFAYLDDELVGISLNDDGKVDEGSGYVRTLGVQGSCARAGHSEGAVADYLRRLRKARSNLGAAGS